MRLEHRTSTAAGKTFRAGGKNRFPGGAGGACHGRSLSVRRWMLNVGCWTFAFLATTLHAAPDAPFYRQDESAQHFLLEKSQRFRLFQHNTITLGQGAQWDADEKLTDTPCFRLFDESNKASGHFRQHNTMWVAPCTEYVLTYMIKVDRLNGAPPVVEFSLYDYNTDVIGNKSFPAAVDGPTDGWVKRDVTFKTDYFTHEVMLQLNSDGKGTCDVRFDKVYLEQVSEPGALMPPPKVLLENESARFDGADREDKEFSTMTLPSGRSFYRLSFDIAWEDFDGNGALTVDWIGQSGNVIAQDTCTLNKIEGVQKEWDGIATRWKKQSGRKSDKASQRLDWHYNDGESKGKGSVAHVMKASTAAHHARIRIVKDEGCKGELHFDKVTFVARH